jgi:hypothetical protein
LRWRRVSSVRGVRVGWRMSGSAATARRRVVGGEVAHWLRLGGARAECRVARRRDVGRRRREMWVLGASARKKAGGAGERHI